MERGDFIAKWRGVKGGQERANYGQFINDFCHALDLPLPQPAEAGVLGDYQFEGPVPGGGAGGNTGAIDLYKKGHFILEAKQSKLPPAQKHQAEMFDVAEDAPASPSGARYDRLMRDALAQAKRYAVNLPSNHPWPPFLIVCDVGRAFELYFDYSGNGRGYGYFPDQSSYRFDITRFEDPDVQAIFRAIWTNPAGIDPRARSAEVSRSIATKLAEVSRWLEQGRLAGNRDATDAVRSLAIEETALFLMRMVFCLFAEDVGLLPEEKFTGFLKDSVEFGSGDQKYTVVKVHDQYLARGLERIWQQMDSALESDRYSMELKSSVRHFNGGLFASNATFTLGSREMQLLIEAADANWTKVEPAIFGTLLEQALTASERSKLGAHYTPRPYVERLVQATIMDVLEGEWEGTLSHSSKEEELMSRLTQFHHRLASLRILDPACGTGNFLYVAMENLMRLESDVIETIRQLGGTAEPKVGPQQFLGLELNPRAAVIAELVLWIGWLRWRMKNDPDAAPEPVLKQYGNINFGGHAGYDAVLRRTATGEPDTDNPMMPDWPEADFIIGNPPFIGKGAMMRAALGGDYAEALWKANSRVPKSADFVMQWWDRAAHMLVAKNSPLIRFGFVTTNSITQTFSRRVIEGYLAKFPSPEGVGLKGLSLILAIPDHPWTKATKDAAAVRIAMTVAECGAKHGRLVEIVHEDGLASDNPRLDERASVGRINPDLTIGADVTSTQALKANDGLSCNGMMLAGQGFKVTTADATELIRQDGEPARKIVRPYLGGSELVQRPKSNFVIDLFGLTESEARKQFPACYTHVLHKVKPERDVNRREAFKKRWWVFGEPRRTFRPALDGLTRYMATTETTKHRLFQFLDVAAVPDHMIIAIGSDEAFHLGVLSSRFHTDWALVTGGTLEDRPRYNKASCFDPFPFPDATPEQRVTIAELAEELDETRKAALAETSGLTMTEIYNWRDKLRRGVELDFIEQARAAQARARIVNRLHEQIDAAVAEAYGWPADLAPAEIVTRLVALNAERAKEEAAGNIRWLRPDYQIPRFGSAKGARIG